MGTLSGLLNMSQSALAANQAAIEITSNNVANQNKAGYTRQIAAWQETDTVSLSGSASVGTGVQVQAVSQRDRVLEQRVQQQIQSQASAGARSDALLQLEAIFGMSSTTKSASSTAIGSSIDGFFNSLTLLQATPGDHSVRQGVLSAAQGLTANFNSASSQIGQQAASLNQQVPGLVDQVNSLTASIAALNLAITSNSPNHDAGALEDQRQHDLAQLSQYVGINQTKTENNGITLTTSNGALLVSGGQSFALGTTLVGGNVDVVSSAAAGGKDITSGLTGGQLGGVLQTRDQDLPVFSAALNSLAYAIGSQVNAQNSAGLDGNGNAGTAIFTLPGSSVGAAAGIAVVTTDAKAIAAAAMGEGSSGNGNAAALSGLQTATMVNGQTASGFFASFLSQLGNTVSSASASNTVQQASLTQLTTQRNALSGVSLDEEAASLMQFQRSYQAAAKVFSIVNQLFATALNLGQQTTVN